MIKKHKPCIGDYVMVECYKAKLAKLKHQLAIAVAALEKYADDNEWMDDLGYGYRNKFPEGSDIAQQALQQIKECNDDENNGN